MAASDGENRRLESNLKEMGHKLMHPPNLPADRLLLLLDEVENCLKRVDQSPRVSMLKALSTVIKALVANHLFRHSNEDVKVAVASCIAEITRITAPNAPYKDKQMKEVFKLILSSLKDLSNKCSRSYLKRVSILEDIAHTKLCTLMLDLDCDALIIEMFQHFFKAMRDYHPQNVFWYMEKIMTLVLEESDNISMDLLLPILHIVKKDNKEVLPMARELVVRALGCSASNLKPYLMQAVKMSGFSLCHYSEVVAFICEETSDYIEKKDAVTNDLQGKDDSLTDLNSFKKKDHDNCADRAKNIDKTSIAEPDNLRTDKVVNSECKSDTKNRFTKPNLLRTESSANLHIHENEVEDVLDPKKDSNDLPGSFHQDLSVNASLLNQNETGIRPSNLELEPIEPSENLYTIKKEVETFPNHKRDRKDDAPGVSDEDLSIHMAVFLQNKDEADYKPSLEPTEPSEKICICEKEVEPLSHHKKESKDTPSSLHGDLSVEEGVSFQNHKETVVPPTSPKPKGHAPTDPTSAIPSGNVYDAKAQRVDSKMNSKIKSIIDDACATYEGTRDFEAALNRFSGEMVAVFSSNKDKSPAKVDETKMENGTATTSKVRPLEQSLKKLDATSKNRDGLSTKLPELNQKQDLVECKSSTRNDEKASVSVEYGENPAGLKVELFWLKDQIGKMSASQEKVSPREPSNAPTSAINSDLVIHLHNGLPKKRKCVAPSSSACEKRACYKAVEGTQNSG